MKPIDRRATTLADSAYQRISDALLAGTIEPGSRLVMDQLAQELDISRTPVRDALLRLEREGLIEPSGRRGYVVRAVGVDDSIHLYEARESVECFAARRAAAMGAPAIEHVRAAVRAAAGTDLSDVRAVYEANLAIHRSFVEVLDNPVMLDLFDVVWQGARGLAMFGDYLAHASDQVAIDVAHEPLVKALEAGPDVAEKAMCEHIAAGRTIHES
ncbi:MAG: GntR family transcriptional regulator [Actinomycetota bacterium]|nr:GntR family transcriptional regulator [Actinomycetota bacterium]